MTITMVMTMMLMQWNTILREWRSSAPTPRKTSSRGHQGGHLVYKKAGHAIENEKAGAAARPKGAGPNRASSPPSAEAAKVPLGGGAARGRTRRVER